MQLIFKRSSYFAVNTCHLHYKGEPFKEIKGNTAKIVYSQGQMNRINTPQTKMQLFEMVK